TGPAGVARALPAVDREIPVNALPSVHPARSSSPDGRRRQTGLIIPIMRIWNSAWTLLIMANLFWAGNIVMARGIAGQVPPIALAWWRWTGAFAVALGFAWPHLKRDYRAMLRQWPLMLLLAGTGIASYNTMSYIGLTSTTALNVLLLQSASPLIIIVWAFALFGDRPSWRQAAGVMISLAGVAAIASRGSADALLHLQLNRGDLWVLVALAIYAVYCVIV